MASWYSLSFPNCICLYIFYHGKHCWEAFVFDSCFIFQQGSGWLGWHGPQYQFQNFRHVCLDVEILSECCNSVTTRIHDSHTQWQYLLMMRSHVQRKGFLKPTLLIHIYLYGPFHLTWTSHLSVRRTSSSLPCFKVSQVSGLCIEIEMGLFSWKCCKERNIWK